MKEMNQFLFDFYFLYILLFLIVHSFQFIRLILKIWCYDLPVGKYQPPSNAELSMKKDKPRKSRWCDQRNNDSDSSGVHHSTQNSNNATHNTSSLANENDFKLSSLTGTLTTEQIDKLAKMGIETISQVTQLTVLQVIELGLSIALISELQLKAVQVNICTIFIYCMKINDPFRIQRS